MRQRWRAQQPTCLHGHPFPQNLFHNSSGYAQCRACFRKSKRAWASKHPDRRPRRRTYIPAAPDPIAIDRAVGGGGRG
ncbi:hypothetical protein EAO70_36330, partial [Streptomyces sp. adm13(2018)]|uniref:hypothetical protein n=1 Tax=Streptomyces sp. adm13(2018) TaxID=2479007 RepID=UPI0011CD83C0